MAAAWTGLYGAQSKRIPTTNSTPVCATLRALWVVVEVYLLLTSILFCRWFRQTKYSSFQRQLNIYEFKRISTGPDKNGYYHLSFQRGKFDLLPRIKRVTVKGTGIRKAPHPEEEPDFYQTVTEDSSQASLSSVGVPPLTWNASRAPLNSQHLFDHASLGGHGIAPAISNLYPPLTQQLDLRSVLQRAQHMLEERQLRESLNRWTRMNPGTHPLYLPSMGRSVPPPTTEGLLQRLLMAEIDSRYDLGPLVRR